MHHRICISLSFSDADASLTMMVRVVDERIKAFFSRFLSNWVQFFLLFIKAPHIHLNKLFLLSPLSPLSSIKGLTALSCSCCYYIYSYERVRMRMRTKKGNSTHKNNIRPIVCYCMAHCVFGGLNLLQIKFFPTSFQKIKIKIQEFSSFIRLLCVYQHQQLKVERKEWKNWKTENNTASAVELNCNRNMTKRGKMKLFKWKSHENTAKIFFSSFYICVVW